MSDNFDEGQELSPAFGIYAQFIKDLSFENPGVVNASESEEAPKIGIDLRVSSDKIKDSVYNVTLHIKAEANVKDKPLFILELSYSGIFGIENVSDDMLPAILYVECPRMLFPFARSIVSSVTGDGGFPPLLLAPVNFAELYTQEIQKAN